MKGRVIGVVAAIGMFSMVLTGVAAANSGIGGDPGSNGSPCGAVHGAFADVNGNFGYIGPLGGTPGLHDGAVGQDPGATGYNNSTASASCTS